MKTRLTVPKVPAKRKQVDKAAFVMVRKVSSSMS